MPLLHSLPSILAHPRFPHKIADEGMNENKRTVEQLEIYLNLCESKNSPVIKKLTFNLVLL